MTAFSVPRSDIWTEGDLKVALALPLGAKGPVPLLLLLDGQSMFLTATEYARTVHHVTMGALPPIAVAGVWRETGDPLEYVATRFRDFTPYEWVLPDPFAADNVMASLGTGGAPTFLDLLVDRVLPSVRTRVEVGEITVGGWSLSGLFSAWAWRERPDVFRHLVSISPSLWWAERRLVTEGVAPRSGCKAFVSAGECEEGDLSRMWPQVFADPAQREYSAMRTNAVAFGDLLAAAGVDTRTVVFADEHHCTLVPASLARAVQHLFAGA